MLMMLPNMQRTCIDLDRVTLVRLESTLLALSQLGKVARVEATRKGYHIFMVCPKELFEVAKQFDDKDRVELDRFREPCLRQVMFSEKRYRSSGWWV